MASGRGRRLAAVQLHVIAGRSVVLQLEAHPDNTENDATLCDVGSLYSMTFEWVLVTLASCFLSSIVMVAGIMEAEIGQSNL